jgi:hypothetical protein
VEYGCRDDYGSLLTNTSAWAGLFYFASRAAGAEGEAQPLITFPEGNGRFVAHLHGRAADHTRTGVMVTDIAPLGPPATEPGGRAATGPGAGDGMTEGVEVRAYDRATNRAVGYRAGRVIFAAPQFLARHLVRAYRERPPAFLSEFEYAPWLVANLQLREHPAGRGFPIAWDNVLYESPSLGYVVATHQGGQESGPTVLTYYHAFCDTDPRQARLRLLQGDWNQWARFVLADMERAHPEIRSMVERLDIMRWGHGMIRPRPGFMASSGRRQAARPAGGIHFANTDLSGVALLEEALYHGVRAAEEVLMAGGHPTGGSFLG